MSFMLGKCCKLIACIEFCESCVVYITNNNYINDTFQKLKYMYREMLH